MLSISRISDKISYIDFDFFSSIFRIFYCNRQELLARTVRYESFGRRRVIIRKGHIGVSFYMIASGSVSVVIQGKFTIMALHHCTFYTIIEVNLCEKSR